MNIWFLKRDDRSTGCRDPFQKARGDGRSRRTDPRSCQNPDVVSASNEGTDNWQNERNVAPSLKHGEENPEGLARLCCVRAPPREPRGPLPGEHRLPLCRVSWRWLD